MCDPGRLENCLLFQVLRQLIINKIIVTNVVLETGGAHGFV